MIKGKMIVCPHCNKEHEKGNHFCPLTGKPVPLNERMIGLEILARYKVNSFIGSWIAGGIFEVEDTGQKVKRPLLMKMVHPRFIRQKQILDRYVEMVEKWRGLSSRNIVGVVEVSRDESGVPVVVRHIPEGLCLGDVISAEGFSLNLGEVSEILRGILSGLEEAHKAGVINGRMSFDSIYVGKGDSGGIVPLVSDFGEYILEELVSRQERYEGIVKLFKAPEQIRDDETQPASDIFAAGVLLYRLVTGKFPYPDGIAPKPRKVPAFVPATEVKKDLPAVLDYTLRRAMAIFPRDRFRSPVQFASSLEKFIPESKVVYDKFVTGFDGVAWGSGKAAKEAVEKEEEKHKRERAATLRMEAGDSQPSGDFTREGPDERAEPESMSRLEEAVVRQTYPPSKWNGEAPPDGVKIPYEGRPDAWKEERKLVPRSSKPPSHPPVDLSKIPPEAKIAPAAVDLPVEKHKVHTTPARQREAGQPHLHHEAKPQAVQEESLAPIMPGRYAKWFILGAIVVVTFIAYQVFKGLKGGDDSGRTSGAGENKGSVVARAKSKIEGKPATAVAKKDAGEEATDAGDVVDIMEGEEAGKVSLLVGIISRRDVVEDEAEEEVGEKVKIEFKVAPDGAKLIVDGKEVKKPYELEFDKSDKIHIVRVQMEGYREWSGEFKADRDRSIKVELEKIKATQVEQQKSVSGGEEGVIKKTPVGKKKKKKRRKKPERKKKGGIVEEVPF